MIKNNPAEYVTVGMIQDRNRKEWLARDKGPPMNGIDNLTALYSNAIARAEKAEEALRVERERCADVADDQAMHWGHGESSTLYGQGYQSGCRATARAIRRLPPPPVRETP